MSFKIEKGSYTNTLVSANLSGNQTITLPNATGTVALTDQLATVATSGSYNDLIDKPNIPESQAGYVTQIWRDGANWYRVWSDGWIEQGGEQSNISNDGSRSISLSRSFSDTSYHVLGFPYYSGNANVSSGLLSYGNKTVNSFTCYNGKDQRITLNWYAYGY